MMGLLNPKNPTLFPESHVVSAIFEPIKSGIGPKETKASNPNFFSKYSKMEPEDDPNWKFG